MILASSVDNQQHLTTKVLIKHYYFVYMFSDNYMMISKTTME
jgi:hypothetical protein